MSRIHHLTSCFLAVFLLTAAAVDAASTLPVGAKAWCGTGTASLEDGRARHRMARWRLARERRDALAKGDIAYLLRAPETTRRGKVAAILDDGSLVTPANFFDLSQTGLRFKRRGDGFRARRSAIAVSADLGDRVELADDASIELHLAFGFRFYGTVYDRVFLNSDGNLTFGRPDASTVPRTVARALIGQPRILGLYTDLDPSAVAGTRGVFVANTSESLRVTWVEVPEFGTQNRNTFQVTLLPSGDITIAFADVGSVEGIVGTVVGGGAGFDYVDYSEDLPFGPSGAGVLERFMDSPELDDLAVAAALFQRVKDVYDHLIVFLDFPLELEDTICRGGFACEVTIKNEIEGIGTAVYDSTAAVGSDGRLRSFVQMGPLANYPEDPDQEFLGTNSALELVAHEVGHRWLAMLEFQAADGSRSTDLLGRQAAHWSFFLDSDASVLEGNRWQDNGNGTFTSVESTERYSALDQYAMGLVPAAQVGDFFYILDDGSSGRRPESPPREGVFTGGTRVDVSIDQILAVEGPRVPSSVDARKRFKMAFVLVSRAGEPASQKSINKLNRIARRWKSYFTQATSRNGRVSTKIRLRTN